MAKQIRWRVPFASVSGTQYEVEIYDENWAGSPVVLTAGATPFVTDEDASDDFFAPVRSQTGTLQVCTLLEDGTMLRLEDILPDNNIARPVQLRRVADNVVEWQGFLSCEAYTQDYIGIPQVLDLSLISVLEAMDSVECDIEQLNDICPTHYIIGYVLKTIEDKAGIKWNRVYVAETLNDMMFKYIDTSILYSRKSRINEGFEEHYPVGVTLTEALRIIATFVGWCVREHADSLYIQYVGTDTNMIHTTVADLYDLQWHNRNTQSNEVAAMADLTWRGADHKMSVRQGAKSVEVTASIPSANVEMEIPDGMPIGGYIKGNIGFYTPDQPTDVEEGEEEPMPGYPYASAEQNFSNIYEFQNITTDEDSQGKPCLLIEGSVSQVFNQSAWKQWPASPTYLGAMVLRLWDEQKESDTDIVGLYVNGTDADAYTKLMDETHYCFRMRSVLHLNAYNGKLRFIFNGYIVQDNRIYHIKEGSVIYAVVKWGDKYLQSGYTWSTTPAIAALTFNGEDGGMEIPIKEYHHGELQVMIMPIKLKAGVQQNYQYFLTEFSAAYERPEDVFGNREQNTYYQSLGTPFRDDISIENKLASVLHNEPSPALVLHTYEEYDPIQRLAIDSSGQEVRPELHMLERLAYYYYKPRRIITLTVAPIGTPLPRLSLNGINDGKVYAPMAESRDWQQDAANITCMEVPK
jgi:hypothetical protein